MAVLNSGSCFLCILKNLLIVRPRVLRIEYGLRFLSTDTNVKQDCSFDQNTEFSVEHDTDNERNTSIRNKKKLNTSEKIKAKVELNPEIQSDIENGKLSIHHHAGIIKPKVFQLPNNFTEAAIEAAKDYSIKVLINDSKNLVNKIRSRHSPLAKNELEEKKRKSESIVIGDVLDDLPIEEKDELIEKNKPKLVKTLKTLVHKWEPFNFDTYLCFQYLFGRSAAEYAVLMRIFAEISLRDPNFMPKTYFDFGSGIGTGVWAASEYWKKSIFEYFCVDSSADMNDLAFKILKLGKGNKNSVVKGALFRQFLPAKPIAYDLVICAYTLFELPSMKNRLQTILNLWNKTQKYLVIVEYGSNNGFKLINEVRDYILGLDDVYNSGHVFSPCSHDAICPRFVVNDGTPCNFIVKYMTIPTNFLTSKLSFEKYSYVVLKKGKKDMNDQYSNWSRLVRPTSVRSKHCRCRMCGTNGKLEEIVFTKSKYGKIIYQCARSSDWGDLLPMKIVFPNEQNNNDNNESNECEENIHTQNDEIEINSSSK